MEITSIKLLGKMESNIISKIYSRVSEFSARLLQCETGLPYQQFSLFLHHRVNKKTNSVRAD
jgi:hypothetical protein